jgi:hypothetical protein
VDSCDGDDHVENLFERKVVADFVSLLCGEEERMAGRKHPGAAFSEYGIAAVPMGEQLGGDVALAGRKGEEAVQPRDEHRSGRLRADCPARLADGVNFVGVGGVGTRALEVSFRRR